MIARLLDRIRTAEASTRSIALIRIGIALILWTRFANDLAIYRNHPWQWMVIALSLYASSTMLLVGYKTRLAALWTGLSLVLIEVYLGVIQWNPRLIHHHISLLLIVTLLLALTPCGRSLSVDRWLAVRRAERHGESPPAERGPMWGTWLICLQVSAIYFWGAVDKSHLAWLSGERTQHIYMYFYSGSDMADFAGFEALMMVIAVGTVVLEYLLAFALWRRSWQRYLIPIAILFHTGVYATTAVATFSVTMFVLLFAFIEPDAVHRAIDRLLGHEAK